MSPNRKEYGTRSILQREISSQPAVLERILRLEQRRVARLAQRIRAYDPRLVLIVARGSADNAGIYGKYLFGAFNNKVVALAAPSLVTRYGQIPDLSGALVIAVSQSGQSYDIVETTEAARRAGALTVAITNTRNSPLAQVAKESLFCHAGLERSVAATKTYTAQLALLALLSAAVAEDSGRLAALERVPEAIAEALTLEAQAAQVAERLRYLDHCAVIGRGFCYGTAFEIALKLAELTYVMAQPYSSADFWHGPIAVVDRGFCVVLLAPRGKVLADVRGLLDQLRARQADVIAISNAGSLLRRATLGFRIDDSLPEWIFPLVGVIPGQLLAMHLCRVKSLPLDKPRGLAKVTRTR